MEEAAKVLIKYDLVEPTGPDVADSVDPRIEELLKVRLTFAAYL